MNAFQGISIGCMIAAFLCTIPQTGFGDKSAEFSKAWALMGIVSAIISHS